MKAILFDLDGVLYVGDKVIAGAVETVQWCHNQAIPHLFVTNTTSKPRSAIAAKLVNFGINVTVDEILTPPVAAVEWLREKHYKRLGLFVSEITRQEFAEFAHIENEDDTVEAVIVGDMGDAWDFMTLNRAFRFLMQAPQPQLVALGLTRYWRAPDGLRLDAGAYVAALQYAAGIDPVVMGKPAAAFFQTALHKLNVSAGEAIMIGDDMKGDIGGAQLAGLRGILVRSGKFREADLRTGITPHAILDSIADLPGWWEQATP